MTRLEALLARALDAAPVSAAERATLDERISEHDAVTLGRLVRLGVLRARERDALRQVPVDAAALERLVRAELAPFARPGAALGELVAARDAAESVLVLLGALELEEAELRARAEIDAADAAMLARRDAWSASAVAAAPWLVRLAEQDASTWWLDLVSLAALRARGPARALAEAFRDGSRAGPLALRRSAAKRADQRLYAEVVGMEEDPARAAVTSGDVIARLFDGEVEVFAIGLRPEQVDLPAGLCVTRAGGGSQGLERVELRGVDPALGGRSDAGWWAPLPPGLEGAQELVVRFDGREEHLALDIRSREGA